MFSLVWSTTAQTEFTIIVFAHSDRAMEIDDAGDDIDDKLRNDPAGHGQHLSEDLWRITSGPLAAYYSIEGDMVLVDTVHWIG